MPELMVNADACGVEVRDSEQDVTHDPFTPLWWRCSHGCEFLGTPAHCAPLGSTVTRSLRVAGVGGGGTAIIVELMNWPVEMVLLAAGAGAAG